MTNLYRIIGNELIDQPELVTMHSLLLNGTTQYALMTTPNGDDTMLRNDEAWTVGCWFRSAGAVGSDYVWYWGDRSVFEINALFITGAGVATFRAHHGTNLTKGTGLRDGNWHLVLAKHVPSGSSPGTYFLSVDGSTFGIGNAMPATDRSAAGTSWILGAQRNGASYLNFWQGWLDQFAIWNVALSDADAALLWNAGGPPRDPRKVVDTGLGEDVLVWHPCGELGQTLPTMIDVLHPAGDNNFVAVGSPTFDAEVAP